MKRALVTFCFGLGLLIAVFLQLLLGGGEKTVIYPFPALALLSAVALTHYSDNTWVWVAGLSVIPVLLFFVWNPGLFRGDKKIPKRSYGLLAGATALSVIWFVLGWRDGLEHLGVQYTYSVCAINLVWVASLWTMFTQKWKSGAPSFKVNLFLHWILFAWR
jgi:hypothetical protein